MPGVPENTKDPAGGERGPRINQPFHHIDTFPPLSLTPSPSSSASKYMSSRNKSSFFDGQDTRGGVTHGHAVERRCLLALFSADDHESEFDEKVYGDRPYVQLYSTDTLYCCNKASLGRRWCIESRLSYGALASAVFYRETVHLRPVLSVMYQRTDDELL